MLGSSIVGEPQGDSGENEINSLTVSSTESSSPVPATSSRGIPVIRNARTIPQGNILRVTTTSDENDGSNAGSGLSLRDAILFVNNASRSDIPYEIVLEGGKTYNLTLNGSYEDAGRTGDLDIRNKNLIIRTEGEGKATIDAGGLTQRDRVFHVLEGSGGRGANFKLENLVITGGKIETSNYYQQDRGGMWIEDGYNNVEIIDTVITNNFAGGYGGGINADTNATLTFEDSIISNNTAGTNLNRNSLAFGGGGFFDAFTDVTIRNTDIKNNDVIKGHSGGLHSASWGTKLTIDGSRFEGNKATHGGGGLTALGDTVITNTEFYRNNASTGAGGFFTGKLKLSQSVASENIAHSGGGFYLATESTEIKAVQFIRNKAEATDNGLYAGAGGAVAFGPATGKQDLTGLEFIENEAELVGGAIAITDGGGATTVNIRDSSFDGNQSRLGGALYADGYRENFNIENALFINNSAVGGAAGYFKDASGLTLKNSIVRDNTAKTLGGAFASMHRAVIEVDNSIIEKNKVENGVAGGFYNAGTLTVKNAQISNNEANEGGCIINAPIGNAFAYNTTFSGNIGNTSGEKISGGAIFNAASGGLDLPAEITIVNSTIAYNSDGIFNQSEDDISYTIDSVNTTLPGIVKMYNTIVAGNGVGDIITDYGNEAPVEAFNNLIGNIQDITGFNGTNILNVDPLLEPLANKGGFTKTHALLPDSPAIDAGDNSYIPAGITTDQRVDGFDLIIN